MNILLWRSWEPLYNSPAIFSNLAAHPIGGTCIQLLWHAKHLAELGHRVYVLGVTREDITEQGVVFLGAESQEEQLRILRNGLDIDAVLFEGGIAAAPRFRELLPRAKFVHVGQNIDRYWARTAFSYPKWIDIYAMVGVGQFANYCVRMPGLRHKFLLLRNCLHAGWFQPDESVQVELHKVVWVGHWNKKGLRQWAETMSDVGPDFPRLRWSLCGPKYTSEEPVFPQHVFAGLSFPSERVSVKHLPLHLLLREIASAQIVVVSLGNECGPISILDAHAMGRPVLSGNDIVYKYVNPEGTGCRVHRRNERNRALRTLLSDVSLCDKLGRMGRHFVLQEYSADRQKEDLDRLLTYVQVLDELGASVYHPSPGPLGEQISEWVDKLKRHLLPIRRGGDSRPPRIPEGAQ